MNDENPASDHSNNAPDGGPEVQRAEPVKPPEAREPHAETELQEVKRQLTGYEKSTLLWTRVVVGINLLTCLFVGLQYREMKSGSKDTHTLAEAAKTQSEKMSNVSDAADKIRKAAEDMVLQDQRIADNAKDSLDASNRQSKAALDASIAASKLDQRAWVVLKHVSGVPEVNKPWNVQIYFINTGKTPARNVRMTCHITYTTGESAEHLIEFAATVPDTRPTLIAPNDPSTFCSLDALLPLKISRVAQDTLDSFSGGKLVLFAHGFATYDDVAGTKHWVTFCRVMDGDGKTWHGCKTHNDTGDGDKPPN